MAPNAFAITKAVTPTPEVTPGMKTHSPAFNWPCTTSMSNATNEVNGIAAACSQLNDSGMCIASRSGIRANSAKAPGQRPITRSPTLNSETPSPHATTDPAASMPICLKLPDLCNPWPKINSPRFNPAAHTFTKIWFGPGLGISTLRNSMWAFSPSLCIQ